MQEKCVSFARTGLLALQAAFSGQDRRRQKVEMITVSLDKDLTAFSYANLLNARSAIKGS